MKHYRIFESHDSNGINIRCEIWHTYKETEKGYWIVTEYVRGREQAYDVKWLKKSKQMRWVSKDSVRKYAYKNLQEALHSFSIRKKRQNDILKLQLEVSDLVVRNMKNIVSLTEEDLVDGFNIGETPSHYRYCFD